MLRFGSFVAAAVLALGLMGMFDTASAQTPDPRNWRQVDPDNTLYIDTVHGRIVVELYPEIAPRHVERIKALTRLGFYDGLTFHRVVDDFMAQTGDPLGTGEGASSPAGSASGIHVPSRAGNALYPSCRTKPRAFGLLQSVAD
jgi:peptidylprolyl isomerase